MVPALPMFSERLETVLTPPKAVNSPLKVELLEKYIAILPPPPPALPLPPFACTMP